MVRIRCFLPYVCVAVTVSLRLPTEDGQVELACVAAVVTR